MLKVGSVYIHKLKGYTARCLSEEDNTVLMELLDATGLTSSYLSGFQWRCGRESYEYFEFPIKSLFKYQNKKVTFEVIEL